ncbi:phosphate ABC transporter substrate-binding protein [Puniceibacterium sp. IMCC21224]|uniref:phosphate ABC transporter substrate-binding protein n=1 Tax=Puniceibacterium sp. IMCC21224 TaxID=1618204 RepID=UPI00064DBF55|nr:phosphate ABC transporter substrate-binding protein [Puniceibacterium sp. IMCC21224]KMK65170.1 4,5-dihydroxyphthalate decarboxylase [Puniceibacterium sp. IMCC21224]
MTQKIVLQTLLADYAVTSALKKGEIASDLIEFAFAPLPRANKGFKPMVREMRYDAGELAIVTFLQAREAGVPLVLLPATLSGRFQHQCIVYNTDLGEVRPGDLAGKRIGVRAYTQTTGMWVRGILQNQFGADLDEVEWITFEDAHVASYVNPSNVVIAAEDKKLDTMLLDGELDAALLGVDMPDDPRLRSVIPDPKAAAQDWYRDTGAISMNHMAVMRADLARDRPEIAAEWFRLLKESKARANLSPEIDMRPYGFEALRPGLALAIKYCRQQHLLARDVTVEELFSDATIGLA